MKIISEIITFIENEPRISHIIIATETDNNPISIRKLIDKYYQKLALFGELSFQMTPVSEEILKQNPDAKQTKVYFLNESQATLLLTFMRNNEIVINFKVRLVQEFFKMRTQFQISKPQKQTNLISVSTENMRKEFEALEFTFKHKNISELEKDYLLKQTLKKINFTNLDNLTEYRETFSLTELLEIFHISILPQHFNWKLRNFGIIKWSQGNWILLDFKFGRNFPFDEKSNPRYFKSHFQELLNIVL